MCKLYIWIGGVVNSQNIYFFLSAVIFINDSPRVEGNSVMAEFRTNRQPAITECRLNPGGPAIDCMILEFPSTIHFNFCLIAMIQVLLDR